jgi:type IV fimbrial biogenesis protein FimT
MVGIALTAAGLTSFFNGDRSEWRGNLDVRTHARSETGYTLAELMMVAAVIGILAVLAMPTFINYWRSSTLRAGAQELASAINLGRQLAISRNTTVCVQVTGTSIVMSTGGCAGTIWTGPGTDGAGAIRLANAMQVSAGGNVVFTNLGAASTAGAFTVTNPVGGEVRTVNVLPSGRVIVQ